MKVKKEPVIPSWSGGKDSAMVAYHLLASQKYEIVALLTTVTEDFDRISMHGVRTQLLEQQADSLAVPLYRVMIPKDCSNETYASRMNQAFEHFKNRSVTKIAFGDLFLADIMQYRDEALARAGMTGVYPIWLRDTDELVRTFIELGFRAILVCIDTHTLDASSHLLQDLPSGADPCGENGEYYSFVFAGPIFGKPIECRPGIRVMRASRFNYCDLLPTEAA